MGWQAHVTVDPWTGLSLHDVSFKGDRIAYEIGVQDQFVAYSGYSSIGQVFYFDDAYQLGGSSAQLRCCLVLPPSKQQASCMCFCPKPKLGHHKYHEFVQASCSSWHDL